MRLHILSQALGRTERKYIHYIDRFGLQVVSYFFYRETGNGSTSPESQNGHHIPYTSSLTSITETRRQMIRNRTVLINYLAMLWEFIRRSAIIYEPQTWAPQLQADFDDTCRSYLTEKCRLHRRTHSQQIKANSSV